MSLRHTLHRADPIPMRSASERRDAAAKVLVGFDARTRALGTTVETSFERELVDALRPLLEVPEVGITEDEIVAESIAVVLGEFDLGGDRQPTVAHLLDAFRSGWLDAHDTEWAIRRIGRAAVRSAEQAALEHWESADVPSQEFMLRHLGIEYREVGDYIVLDTKRITKEVI